MSNIIVTGRSGGSVVIAPGSGKGQVEIKGSGVRYPIYDGPTTVTPEANEMQILQTENKVVMENIVVMPIPSNYGLITYNGRTITVS